MLIQLLAPCLALLVGPIAAGYVHVPLQSPAGVTYVNSQQHVGLLAGPVRYTSGVATVSPGAVQLADARSGAVSVTPGPTPTYYSYNVQPQARSGPVSVTPAPTPTYYSYNVQPQASSGPVSVTPGPTPTYYSYNVQPQPVFGKASYSPAVQYHHHTAYGGPTVRVYEPRSFVYGVQANNVPSTHTVHTVPVSVSTTQYHHTPEPVPVTPAPHHPTVAVPVPTPVPVHIPVHVPVPVPVTPTYTKTVTTGPTYVEKQVPVVRSRKFKVRRPAIQNQFYDIEERVIIRPVGSALVELEQPISQTETQSKTTKTTTTTFVEKRPPVYVPAPPPPPPPQEEIPAGDSGYGTRTIGRPRVVTQTTTVYTERPQVVVQKNTYDRVRVSSQERSQERTQSGAQTAQSAASISKSSDAEFIDTSANAPTQRPFYTQGHAIYHPPQQTAFVPHPFSAPLAPHPVVYYPGNAGHLLHQVAYLDQHHSFAGPSGALHPASVYHPVQSTTPLYPVTPIVPAAAADCEREGKAPEYLPPTQAPPVTTTTPQPPSASPGSFADEEEEYDDSIVVNARSGAGEANSDTNYEDSTASGYAGSVGSTTVRPTTSAAPTNLHHDKYRGAGQGQSQSNSHSQSQSQERSSIEISYATRTTPASDIVAFDPSTSSGAFNLGPSPSAFRGSFSTTTSSPTTISLEGSAGSSTASSSTPQRSVTIISSTTPRTVSARFSGTDVESSSSSSSSAAISSPSVVVGQGLTQEQIHANQEQFIKLLSERDSIAQVGFDAKGDTTSGTLIDAYVRSRVLSATPAPRDAKESSRTVNIRRIVVSRPVETEQEVEVREQGYATTVSPPSYEHKRDVSDVATARSDAASDESQQPPVYVNAKPPAFANDQDEH
uniref:DUF4794 domain-containing protein n=2 Tax=Anopheles atroparvus TaxID=41427 RepID=A0A182ING5_ANOAO